MRPFITRPDLIEKLLNDIIEKGKITDTTVITEFSEFNLFDNLGNITIPIIVENENNQIYAVSKKIANTIAHFLEVKVDMEMLKKDFGFASSSQATIILYHEMLWDILAQLENNKMITKPIVFMNPDKAESKNISDLILITKK